MSDYHEYEPGLAWSSFVKKFAKNNGLSYNQALVAGREAYHTYKAEEARLQTQSVPRPPKKLRESYEVPKHKRAYPEPSPAPKKFRSQAPQQSEKETRKAYEDFQRWQYKQKQKAKKQPMLSSDDDDSSDSD